MRMKKQFSALLLAIVLCLTLVGTVSAEVSTSSDGGRLADTASLLSRSEYSELSKALDDVSHELGFDVVVVTVRTIGYSTPRTYADNYYNQRGYGPDGILLLVNMGERDIYFSTAGKCTNIFTDYGLDYLIDDIGSYLTDAEYADAVERFIDRCRVFTREYEGGAAFDVDHKLPASAGQLALRAVICTVAGFVVAFIVTESMRSKLRTVRAQTAALYARDQSLEITDARELFLYRNVTRTAIPKNNSSHSGGGSSTHVSSGGVTHGGRGGKF